MLLTLLAALSVTAPEAPARDLASLVPADSVFVFRGHDLASLRQRSEGNSWRRLFADPEFDPLTERLGSMDWAERVFDGETPSILPHLSTLLAAADELVFYAALPEGPAGTSLATLLLDYAPEDAAANEATESVARALNAEMGAREAAAPAGMTGAVYAGDGYRLFQRAGLLALVVAPDRLEDRDASTAAEFARVLHGLGGPAADGRTRDGMKVCVRVARGSSDLPLELFLDLGGIAERAIFEIEELTDDWTLALEDMGLPELGILYVGADVGAGESLDLAFRLDLGEGTALERMLDHTGRIDLDLLAVVQPEATSVSILSFDLLGAFQELVDMVVEYDPSGGGAEAALEMSLLMAESTLGSGVEEILEMFTGSIVSFTVPPSREDLAKLFDMDPTDADLPLFDGNVELYELVDPEGVRDLIGDLLGAFGMAQAVQETEVNGAPAWTLLVEEDTGVLSWSVQGDYLVTANFASLIGTQAEHLARLADATDSPRPDPRYAGLRKAAEGALAVSYVDSRAMAEQVLAVFSGLGPLLALEDLGDDDTELFELLLDLPWPDPAIVATYLEGQIVSRTARHGSVVESISRAR